MPTSNTDGTSTAAASSGLEKARALLAVCGSSIKFAIAVLGIWAIYIAWRGLELQRWSARNDSLQSCKALASRSEYCNKTIAAGVRPLPGWKRDTAAKEVTTLGLFLHNVLSLNPLAAAASTVLTLSAIIAAAVFFRPRVEPFHPMISSVRTAIMTLAGGGAHTYSYAWTRHLSIVQLPWSALMQELKVIAELVRRLTGPDLDSELHLESDEDGDRTFLKDGTRIGLFYDSDDGESADLEPYSHETKATDHNNRTRIWDGPHRDCPSLPPLTSTELSTLEEGFKALLTSRFPGWDSRGPIVPIPPYAKFVLERKKRMLQQIGVVTLLQFLYYLIGPLETSDELSEGTRTILMKLRTGLDGHQDAEPSATPLLSNPTKRQGMLVDVLEELIRVCANGVGKCARCETQRRLQADIWRSYMMDDNEYMYESSVHTQHEFDDIFDEAGGTWPSRSHLMRPQARITSLDIVQPSTHHPNFPAMAPRTLDSGRTLPSSSRTAMIARTWRHTFRRRSDKS